MNMIMHGDGHGGVHHHNGFINVNGIFEGRFDIILTNPPFGANVGVGRCHPKRRCPYPTRSTALHPRVRPNLQRGPASCPSRRRQAHRQPVRSAQGRGRRKVKTEILFIERCLNC